MPRDFVQGLAEIDDRVAAEGYDALHPFERDLYDVNCFHFECVCGGLGVFFTNSAGAHWRETIGALGRVGARRAQGILTQACSLFPGGEPSPDILTFEEQANDPVLQERLGELGHEIDDGEIWSAMGAYWSAHSR
ncbi:MAG: DUF4375 domain-containing protein [Polyangiaceae bacterium]